MVNRVLGASQNWIGGSAISWIHQHVVQHHIHTNDVHLDPDISGSQYVRLNPLKPLMKFHFIQHIYFFVLLAIYGFTVIYQSLCELRKLNNSKFKNTIHNYCRGVDNARV